MLLGYVYKLRPNSQQSMRMDCWLNLLRGSYNWSLADRINTYEQRLIQGEYCDLRTKAAACPLTCCVTKGGATGEPWRDNGKRRSAGEIQITALPQLKESRPWYKDIDSTVLQQNVKRLDKAYENFFKEGRGYPKFKNRSTMRSFTFTTGVKLKGNKIYLPKLGWMRYYNSRPIKNRAIEANRLVIKTLRKKVRRDSPEPKQLVLFETPTSELTGAKRKQPHARKSSKRGVPGNLGEQLELFNQDNIDGAISASM